MSHGRPIQPLVRGPRMSARNRFPFGRMKATYRAGRSISGSLCILSSGGGLNQPAVAGAGERAVYGGSVIRVILVGNWWLAFSLWPAVSDGFSIAACQSISSSKPPGCSLNRVVETNYHDAAGLGDAFQPSRSVIEPPRSCGRPFAASRIVDGSI